MLWFILGWIVGGCLGFVLAAVLSGSRLAYYSKDNQRLRALNSRILLSHNVTKDDLVEHVAELVKQEPRTHWNDN